MMHWVVPVVVAVVTGLVTALIVVTTMRRKVFVPPTVPGIGESGSFTRAEVARHDQPEDAWIIVEGKVYDITGYIDDHPGGAAIMNNLGADNTKAVLHGPQHPETVRDILAMHVIGDLTE
mmetsp:Transcript_1446/g.4297  ORF Transcript_1446/g.4297 Transcript_1446/m.4297 type:complete len:120 (-) Transcript_1446:256-615(-)